MQTNRTNERMQMLRAELEAARDRALDLRTEFGTADGATFLAEHAEELVEVDLRAAHLERIEAEAERDGLPAAVRKNVRVLEAMLMDMREECAPNISIAQGVARARIQAIKKLLSEMRFHAKAVCK